MKLTVGNSSHPMVLFKDGAGGAFYGLGKPREQEKFWLRIISNQFVRILISYGNWRRLQPRTRFPTVC